MRSRLKGIWVLGIACLVLTVSAPLFSQSNSGRISGNVTDGTGAVVRGAAVTITDLQRGTTRTVTTDDAGAYAAPNLPPAEYKIRAEAKGFKSVERPNIELQVATDLRIDFVLPPGEVSETVMVSGEAPLVNTVNAVLGGTLSNEAINDLPLNGRDFQNLVVLRPGIARYPGGGIGSVSADGIRPEDNNFIIDGVRQQRFVFRPERCQRVGCTGNSGHRPAHRCDPGV